MSSVVTTREFGVKTKLKSKPKSKKLRTPNYWVAAMDFPIPINYSLDEILSQMTSAGPPVLSRKVLFWGEGTGEISSYIAGWMAGQGIDVIVLDGANRFDPYVVSSFAKKASISPENLLKRIRIARAFTCYQMATLVEEKLAALLRKEEGISHPHKPWVILLGPVTTFLDEDVPERETRPLFERMLRKMEEMAMDSVSFSLFQPNPPFTKLGTSRNDCRTDTRNRERTGGFVDSKRAFLVRRLFQISDRVWRIRLEEEGPRLLLEKEVQPCVIARTPHSMRGTKQSHEIRHSQNARLLRFARNDNFGDFLREYQICGKLKYLPVGR